MNVSALWAMVAGNWKLLVLVIVLIGLVVLTVLFALWATLLRLRNIRTARRWNALEDKWEKLLPEVASGLVPDKELYARVGRRERLYFVDFLYKTALRGDPVLRDALPRLAAPYLEPIYQRMKGGDPERRARAVQTVALLDLERSAARIREAVDDESPLVAMIAARSLAASGRTEHVAAVMERLDRFEEWSPKFLISMLVSMGPDAAPAIRAAMKNTALTRQTRAVCADALGRMGDRGGMTEAVQILGSESDPDLLAAVLRLVRSGGGPEHLEPVRALAASADFAVRAQAIATLGQIGGKEDVARLKLALRDPSPWVALHAARGLRAHGEMQYLRNAIHAGTVSSDVALQVLAE